MKKLLIILSLFASVAYAADIVRIRVYDDVALRTIHVEPSQELVGGEIVYSDGVRIKSPDGNVWEIRVDNSGVITAVDLSP